MSAALDGGNVEGRRSDQVGAGSVTPSLPPVTLDDWQRAAEAVNGLYVAVVSVGDGKIRRHAYVSLAAAQRRVDKARERGCEASVVLAELRPVFVLPAVVEDGAP